MRPQSCKAKGRRLQQQIVADLLETFPTLTPDDVRSTSMGANGEDVQLSTAAREKFPFSVEAKNQERLNVWDAFLQAKTNTPADADPLLVFKKNNAKPHVMLEWSTFLRLIAPAPDRTLTPREGLIRAAELLRQHADAMDESAT